TAEAAGTSGTTSAAWAAAAASFPKSPAWARAGHGGQSAAATVCTGAARTCASGTGTAGNASASKARTTATRSPAAPRTAACAFGSQDHLQQLIRVVEEIFEFVALSTENFCGELGCDFCASNGRVFGDVANLVYLDTCFASERGFQLLCKRSGFCVAGGKCTHKTRKVSLSEVRREVNASDSRSRKKLREATFRSGCAERNSIEQNLLTGRAEEKSTVAAFVERFAQLFPGRFKLRSSTHVAELVQPCEFQQDVEAADELPRSRSRVGAHSVRREAIPPC